MIVGISNREEFICYTFEKNKLYYKILPQILKKINIVVPDFYEPSGKLTDATKITDSYSYYSNTKSKILEVIGEKRIMLFFFSIDKLKLNSLIDKIAEYKKPKKDY
ncbi:hypothetical protein JXC34_05690 [Candidatus Woesearchaeota archaeon]|nr:hypothetical protein [Candidatus Woesearchaeota archaeon]